MKDKISFTHAIKDELASKDVSKAFAKSVIASFIKLNGNVVFSRNNNRLVLKTETSSTAKYIYKLLKENYPYLMISFSFLKSMKLYKATEYLINVNSGAYELFEDLKLNLLEDKIPYDLQDKEEKIRGYLVGTFLASGSCTDPISSNYHLELVSNDENYAHALIKMINKIKSIKFDFKMIKRRNKYLIYLKRSDQIANFLAFIGADNSCIEFENIRMDRDFSNSTNRLMNCDSYNFKKTIENAKKQIEEINIVENKLGVDNLQNEKLKVLCKARLANPEANYSELAQIVSEELDETVSKSNINHLFIKLRKMVENYEKSSGNN